MHMIIGLQILSVLAVLASWFFWGGGFGSLNCRVWGFGVSCPAARFRFYSFSGELGRSEFLLDDPD